MSFNQNFKCPASGKVQEILLSEIAGALFIKTCKKDKNNYTYTKLNANELKGDAKGEIKD